MHLKQLLLIGIAAAILAGCVGAADQAAQPADSPETVRSAQTSPAAGVTQAEPPPEAIASSNGAAVKTGTFASGEHPTRGTASIVEQAGQRVLKLSDDFETSPMGPDLVVVLHRSKDVLGSTTPPAYPLQEGDYVFLAELQSFTGEQSYAIPAEVNLEDYQSAAIWCRQFNATFGAAAFN